MSNLYGDAKSQLYKWVMNKLTDEDMWVALGTGLLKIIAITICSIILVKLGNHMIKKHLIYGFMHLQNDAAA